MLFGGKFQTRPVSFFRKSMSFHFTYYSAENANPLNILFGGNFKTHPIPPIFDIYGKSNTFHITHYSAESEFHPTYYSADISKPVPFHPFSIFMKIKHIPHYTLFGGNRNSLGILFGGKCKTHPIPSIFDFYGKSNTFHITHYSAESEIHSTHYSAENAKLVSFRFLTKIKHIPQNILFDGNPQRTIRRI